MQRGVYFLGNDAVQDWAIAFLESFRASNPDLALTLIPFDDKIGGIARLAAHYRFDILDHPLLPWLDALGSALRPSATPPSDMHRAFRKFIAFFGKYESFLYLDADIVVLEPVLPIFNALESSRLAMLYLDNAPAYVYRPSAFRQQMVEQYGAQLCSSGAWASRRALFDQASLAALHRQASLDRADFAPGVYDQPFFNYCFDRGGLRYAHTRVLLPDSPSRYWAGCPHCVQRGAHWVIASPGACDDGARLTLLHWAGYDLDWTMPYRELFSHYRLRNEPWYGRLAYRYRLRQRLCANPS